MRMGAEKRELKQSSTTAAGDGQLVPEQSRNPDACLWHVALRDESNRLVDLHARTECYVATEAKELTILDLPRCSHASPSLLMTHRSESHNTRLRAIWCSSIAQCW